MPPLMSGSGFKPFQGKGQKLGPNDGEPPSVPPPVPASWAGSSTDAVVIIDDADVNARDDAVVTGQ